MRSSRLVRAVVVLGLGVLGGCRDGKGTTGGPSAPAGAIASRASALTSIAHTGWTASASQTQSGSPASNAVDGNAGTRWTTGDVQTNQWFKVDLGAPRAFVEVEIQSNATDYPRQFNVQVSNNNSTWTTVASATGTAPLVQVPFAQQQARYVRIQLATSGQQYWLSIYDFNVYSTQHSTATWVATSSGNTSPDTEAKAIDASLTTKWTSSSTQSPNVQWFQVDMRRKQTFNMVSLDGGATTNTTYPRAYKIEASDDGSTWSTLATGTGAAGVIFASFTTTQARYLKVTQTGTATAKWSLYDLLIYGQPEVPSVLSQVGWTASASKHSADAWKSVDSTMSTGWSTETYQAVGDWYQVDMGASRLVSGVTMNSDTSSDYARAFNVYVSDDPMNFGAPAGSGTGSSPFVSTTFAPKMGRYVRVQLTALPGTSDWWQFCEFNVQTPALARAGWIVSASSTGGTDIARDAFDNDSTCRWNSAESQATEHWVTVDMVTQQIFNKITLDASPSALSVGNYPRSYEVYVSNDGTSWGTAVATGNGTGQAITINFLTQTARYIKIRQPSVAGVTNTWSIHELEVFREAPSCATVTCTASDQCHDVGTCDPQTGACSNPVKANGASCSDGNACTQTDTCQGGTCTGANPVVCTGDQCHDPGTCIASTGVCSSPVNKANGTSCNDQNACTQTDTCQAGTCTGGNAVTCTASDQCHVAGTCDTGTGACTNPAKPNGSTCTDGNACTQADTCQAGSCTGGNPVTCTASDQCHVAGTCDTGTGTCSNPAKANGSTCTDGNACTQADTCQAGTCTGGNAVTCTASDQCHAPGTCNPSTGTCSNPEAPNGTVCSDGQSCTTGDVCTAGTCAGAASSCGGGVTITGAEPFFGQSPSLSAHITPDRTRAVPGDQVGYAFNLSYDGVSISFNHKVDVINGGSSTFTIPGFSETVEYFSTASQSWVTLATLAFDQAGNPISLPSPHPMDLTIIPPLTFPGFEAEPYLTPIPGVHYSSHLPEGTTMESGTAVFFTYQVNVTLPPAVAAIVFDPAQVNGLRNVIHFDEAADLPVGADVIANAGVLPTLADLTVTNHTGFISTTGYDQNGATAIGAPLAVPLVPGGSLVVSGTKAAPTYYPREFFFSDGIYLDNLRYDAGRFYPFFGYGFVRGTYNGLQISTFGDNQIQVGLIIPYVDPQKTGPSTAQAGALLPYTVALNNVGTSEAVDITIEDAFGAGASLPVATAGPLANGASTTVTFSQQSTPSASAGSVTDRVAVTWHDKNGNVYGPAPSSFTTALTAGIPNGRLVLTSNGPQRIGEPMTLTVTVLGPHITPVSSIPVTITITGPNARTLNGVTGPDGTVELQYVGAVRGNDVGVASGTIVDGVEVTSVPLTLEWRPAACANRDPDDLGPIVDAGPDQRAAVQSTAPPPSFTMQRISTGFNTPVGIAYHGPTNKMMMSVNCCSGEPHNLELVNRDGTRTKFSNIHGLSDEVYFAIARNEQDGRSLGGFVDGEVLIGTGVPGNIARISPDGTSIVNPWVHLPGETGLLRGQLYLDTTGLYGGDLIVTTTAGGLWRVNSSGQPTRIATLGAAENEGLVVVPNNPTKFGPFAGKILVGTENSAFITAVASDGTKTTHNIGFGVENIMIVPPHENLFGVDWNGAQLWGASASQFNGKVGDLVISEEFGGRLFHVSWNGTTFDKTLLFQAVLWEHTAFGPAGMVEISPAGVALAATVTDNGCPEGGVVTTNWSVLSGPGTVTFSDAHSRTPSASFSNEGTYVLRLTATNGTHTSYDDTTVIISKTGLPNTAPVANAGADQTIRLPNAVDLAGFATDDGVPFGNALGLSWSQVSGPAPMTFVDSTAGFTTALFEEPGTYVLRLTATDGDLSSTDNVTVTVAPEPSLVGGNLVVALGTGGPLALGSQETLLASLTDVNGAPIPNFPVQVTVTGANPTSGTAITNAAGVATFVYTGTQVGTDTLSAVALGTFQLSSNQVMLSWASGAAGPVATQGWIGSPAHQSTVNGLVPVTLGGGVTLTSGTLTYWPLSAPGQTHTLATGITGGPGATIATLDTTVLGNGTWVVELDATNSAGESQVSMASVTVSGEYKPGRIVAEVTDLVVPMAGLPITVGRRYDSLEKDNVGDFGHGWSLTVGNPRLETDPAHNVTITMPDNRRVTFYFRAHSLSNSAFYAWLYGPGYLGEAGTYGSLTADGCPLLINSGGRLVCFLDGSLEYAPTTYTYTDQFGRAYTMAATGELKSIKDLYGNTLTFTPGGIVGSSGASVTFERDGQGRITKVTSPAIDLATATSIVHRYEYDSKGDLSKVVLPDSANSQYTYTNEHRLLTTRDPGGNLNHTSTFDGAGRLATDTDALGNVTTYAYDLSNRTTTIVSPDLGAAALQFDSQGRVLKETDPLGRVTRHEYDSSGNETALTNALNETTTFTYDAKGNSTSITNARGEVSRGTYNDFSQPLTSTDALGHTTTIAYDGHGIPVTFSDESGTIGTFSSSERGLPLSVTDVEGKTAYFTYDGSGNLTAVTDRLGRVTRHTYDGVGRRKTSTDGRGGITQNEYLLRGPRFRFRDASGDAAQDTYEFSFDANLNLVREDSDLGRSTAYTYNVLNQLTKVEHPDHSVIEYTRDFRGNVLTELDESGRLKSYEYDKAGQLKKTTFPDGTFTARTYDEIGRVETETDEGGNTTTYEYQSGCGCGDRVTKVIDPLGRETVTTYDAAGRRTTVTDPGGHTTAYEYDGRGYLVKTTHPDGSMEADSYDQLGRRTVHTDQMGAATRYGYDAEGQLTAVMDPLNAVTKYAYDANGNLTTVTDANNRTTAYEYDALNRKIKRTLPRGGVETFAYNMYSDLTGHTDFRGKTTTLVYDAAARLLTKRPDPTLNEPPVTFTYNATGTRSSMTDRSGTTAYSYDTRDRLLTKSAPAGVLTYSYDQAGNVATIRSSTVNGTSVDYAWNAARQLVSVTDNRAGGVTTSAYSSMGQLNTLTQPTGVAATYGYDALSRVTALSWRNGSSALASWSYGRNARGQQVTSTNAAGRRAAYAYDTVSRLTTETVTGDPRGAVGNGAVSYGLDATGLRLSRSSTLAAIGSSDYSYDANDQLEGEEYDANGNTIATGGHTYSYDFENHLVGKDGQVSIVYDGDGNRVSKTVAGVTTRYLVDDLNPSGKLQVLEEIVNANLQTAYTYGTSVVSQRRGGTVSYYGYDANGNVTFLTDDDGAVTDTYEYDAYGNVLNAGPTANTRLYDGEELDPDLEMINLRARYYSPTRGRFINADTFEGIVSKPQTFGRYTYGFSDPINNHDPLGLNAIPFPAPFPMPALRIPRVPNEYLIFVAAISAVLVAEKAISVGVDGSVIARVKGSVEAVGTKVACAFYTVLVSAFSGVATDPTYVFCRKSAKDKPKKPAIPWGESKVTPQTTPCSEGRLAKLSDAVNRLCHQNPPPRCDLSMDCKTAFAVMQANQACLSARQAREWECFGGGDDGHGQQIAARLAAVEGCRAVLRAVCKGRLPDRSPAF